MRQLFNRPGAHIRVELLSAFLDNQVSPAERARVAQHLTECAACRAELTSLRQTVAVMQALPRVPAPRAFTLSQAQVGARVAAQRAPWVGGLVRGLGAVTAVMLIVVVAATALQRPMAVQAPPVARSAATAVTPERETEALAAAPAPAAALQAPADAAQPAPVAAAPDGGQELTALSAPEAAAETPSPEPEPALAMKQPPAERSAAATATTEPVALALAPPAAAATEAPAAKAAGMGGGAAETAALPADLLVPEPTPERAALAEVLPEAVRLVYTDPSGLWAADGAGGLRQLIAAAGLHTPLLSPDASTIIYRASGQDYTELWGVGWDGTTPRLLLNERELSREGLGADYSERRLNDVRWIPGRQAVAVTIVRVPSPRATGALPQLELWELDLVTAALRYVAPLGRAYWPIYAADGAQFALLEYGADTDPLGQLTIFAADGSNPRKALTFPAGPAKLSYEGQLAWLPDSSALRLAMPAPDMPGPGQYNGTTLYRITAEGQAEETGTIDAYQVAWSPDAARLAYLRITTDTLMDGELYLADANGANAQRYAAVKDGQFVAWSPDGAYFLYQDNYALYLGAAGAPPQRLGTSVSFVNPRWVSGTQFISLHDTGAGWLLTLRSVDGTAYGLAPLSRDALLDVTRP